MLEFVTNSVEQFSFDWSKVGDNDTPPVSSKPNALSFQSVSEEDFGYYQCEVKDAAARKVVLIVYRALYREETSELSNLKYSYFLYDVGRILMEFPINFIRATFSSFSGLLRTYIAAPPQ